MQIPTQVTFRGVEHSDALETDIHSCVAWLEQFYTGIVSCKVLVEVPHRHRQHDRHFHIRVTVTVPGRPPLVVSHEPAVRGTLRNGGEEPAHHKQHDVHEEFRDPHVAVHKAFDIASRQLREAVREMRHSQNGRAQDTLVPDEGLI
jgi:ribosome-associated translation inhibitor RaiA